MKYVSGRVKELKVGISNYSEDKFSLDIVGIVTAGSYRTGSSNLHSDGAELKNLNVSGVSTFAGNVAIGTDNVYDPVGASNTTILAVGILTANTIYSTLYGQFTGGSVVANNIVGSGLSISGISTLGSVQVSSGIITATSGIVTYFGDGSKLTGVGNTANIRTNSLKVLGISTFTGDLDVDGNIIGDNATNISGINSVTATNFFGPLTGNVTGNLTGNADTATSSATVTNAAQPNITSLGSLTGLNVVGVTTVGGDIKANGNIVGDNSTNITGIAGVTATTLAGTLQTAAQPNVTSLGTLSSLSVTGDVSIGGTLTYDDVTNIDSVGLITARNGINVTGGVLNVVGISTFAGNAQFNNNVSTGGLLTASNGLSVFGVTTFNTNKVVVGGASTELVVNGDVRVTGVLTATSFSGDGSGLTGVTASGSGVIIERSGSPVGTAGTINIGDGLSVTNVIGGKVTVTGIGTANIKTDSLVVSGISTLGIISTTDLTTQQLNVSGVTTFASTVNLGDGDRINFNDTNTAIYGDITGLNVESSGTRDIKIQSNASGGTGGDVILKTADAEVLKVVGVTSDLIVGSGVSVVGVVTASGFVGNLTGTVQTATQPNITSVGTLSSLNVVGITSASAFANFGYLQAPYSSTITFTVTVATQDASHRYNGIGSSNKFLINGVQAPVLTLTPGRTYRFTNDNTGSHPLKFYYEADKTTLYTTGVNFQNTYTEISVSDTTPNVLHYQCTAHAYMGNAVVTNSNVVDTPYVATLRKGLNVTSGVSTFVSGVGIGGVLLVTGDITANGNIVGDNATNITGIAGVTASTLTGTLQTAAQPNVTSLGTLTSLNVTGDVSIGGTLTYDDVTNIDSVGLITARSGINVTGGGLNVVGVSTFAGNINANGNIVGDNATNISGISSVTATTYFGDGSSLTGIGASGFSPDGQENLFAGTYAGAASDADTCFNVGLGYSAGTSLNSGDNNVLIGKDSGRDLTSGQYNVFLGCKAGQCSNSTCSIFMGNYAGRNINGINNVFLGSGAGRGVGASSKDACHSVAIGFGAGNCLDSGDFNVFLGRGAGACTTNGGCNFFAGYGAGSANRTGSGNIVIGRYSYYSNPTGSASGGYNVILGDCSGHDITTGSHNVFLGRYTGKEAKSSSFNIVAGYNAGIALTTGSSNIHFGTGNAVNNTGSRNISLGYCVCLPNASGNDQLAIGCIGSHWIQGDSSFNVTLAGIATAYASGIVSATKFCGDGSCLTGVGFNADAQENLYAGTGAGNASDADTCCNIGIGYSALHDNCAGDRNIALGICAGNKLLTGVHNIFLGSYAGRQLTTGSYNTFFGYYAGQNNAGNKNVAIGCMAGVHANGGQDHNVFIGTYAGCCAKAYRNIAIGYQALKKSTSGGCNVILGDTAACAVTSGCFNLVSGFKAGLCISSGSCNIFLGKCAGNTTTTGDRNIAIGHDVELSSATGSNQLGIGSGTSLWIEGDSSYNVTLAGIATVYSATGIVSATKFCGDGSALTGIGLTSGAVTDQTGISTSIGTFNVSAGISTNIDSFAYSSNNYKTAEYTIHFMNGSNTQAQKLLVMQDGVTAFSNEFAVMSSSSLLVSVGATVSGSNVLVQATPETGVSGVTTFRWRREVQD